MYFIRIYPNIYIAYEHISCGLSYSRHHPPKLGIASAILIGIYYVVISVLRVAM